MKGTEERKMNSPIQVIYAGELTKRQQAALVAIDGYHGLFGEHGVMQATIQELIGKGLLKKNFNEYVLTAGGKILLMDIVGAENEYTF